MTVYLNGQYRDETEAMIPITDRGLLYGDGLFETVRCAHGEPLFWTEHLERWHRGLELFQLNSPATGEDLRHILQELLQRNALTDATVRLMITRGSGPRGYSPAGAQRPTLIVSCHPAPAAFGGEKQATGIRLMTSRYQIPDGDPLAVAKHANRLISVLARAEAEAQGAEEALLLNTLGEVAEASGANLFWLEKPGRLLTPPPGSGALHGVMQRAVLELAPRLGLETGFARAPVSRVRSADGLFLTNSVQLILPVAVWDGHPVERSPWLGRLIDALRQNLRV